MKKMKHIWKYITSPSYRFLVDMMVSQEVVNRQMNLMKDQIELSSFTPIYRQKINEYFADYGIAELDAYEILRTKGNIF